MAGPDDDPSGDSHRISRSFATARNEALGRLDVPLEAVAPQPGAGVGGDGEAREGSAGRDPITGNECNSGRGLGPARAEVSRGGGGGVGIDSSLPANPDSSYDPGQPGPAHLAGLRLHSLAANPTTNIASDTGLAGASRTSSPFRVRTGMHFAERAGGGGARMSRSMSSRSRRTTSVSSPIRPLMPTARGLGGALEGPAPRAPSSSTRALAGGSRRVLLFSPSGGGSADGTYRDREAPRGSLLPSQPHQQHQQNQHQQPPPQHQQHQQPHQHPPTAGGCSLRVPARHGGGAGRADGGRASVRRLASGGGRDPWRAPAVAYNAAERRTGRDTTALRVVSARLDAAATAIDAVEIGVRSASDSLDSLLQLLETRPGSTAAPRATPTSSSSSSSRGSTSGGGSSLVVEESSTTGGVPGWSTSGEPTTSPFVDDSETTPIPAARGREGGGGLRAANMLRRELGVGSVPPVGQAQGGEGGDGGRHNRRTFSTPARHGGRDASFSEGKAEEEEEVKEEVRGDLGTPPVSGRGSAPVLPLPRSEPSSVGRGVAEGMSSRFRGLEEHSNEGRRDPATPPSLDIRRGGAAEGSPTAAGRPDEGGGGERSGGGGSTARSRPSSGSVPSPSHAPESRRPSSSPPPRGAAAPGSSSSNVGLSAIDEAGRSAAVGGAGPGGRRDLSLPVLELEVAMSGIDAERERLILEIARLRGQQNQSLVHLQRLQHEQFVVRQRQVSTLSDIVNSFGRTVEAAGALPHGEDSSLGRISSDVVSTLRRMLRLLSATIPSEATEERSAAAAAALASSTAAATSTATTATRPDSSGPSSAGGRAALRGTGTDLTQEVIDAALQALPRLAAAATAISGARRMQGYLADLTADAPAGAAEERRFCSKETIAALPDAPPFATGGAGGVGGDGVGARGCVICLSEGTSTEQHLCRLPCNHVFHRACVGKWLGMQDSCPTCRSLVPNVEVDPPATKSPAV